MVDHILVDVKSYASNEESAYLLAFCFVRAYIA